MEEAPTSSTRSHTSPSRSGMGVMLGGQLLASALAQHQNSQHRGFTMAHITRTW